MRVLTTVALPAAILGLALAAGPARAEVRARLSDAQLQAVVEQALVDRDIPGVTVAVSAGNVTLTGMVPNAWSRSGRVDVLKSGTSDVANRLTVARGESDGHGPEVAGGSAPSCSVSTTSRSASRTGA
jgi:hypothetical protein